MATRREFIRTLAAGAAVYAAKPATRLFGQRPDPWDEVPRILARIKPPVFPARDFDVTKYGAVGNNVNDNTDAFRDAITACSRAGGGRVVVPKGEFLTGAIRLQSSVNLHVSDGATIRFTRDINRYPIVFSRWEGVELMNFSPFIYAFEQNNIALTGSGTIDGNADCQHWWPWKGRTECGWTRLLSARSAYEGPPYSPRE